MTYKAPVDDILLALKGGAGLDRLLDDGVMGELDTETIEAILGEAGRFAEDVLAPLNKSGDRQGASLADGSVTTADGWKEAYAQFKEAGWTALPCSEDYGGQNLPSTIAMAVSELWNSSNLAFGVCPLLTNGATDSLEVGGSEAIKSRFLANMVSGEWTGTMNLTEPQAGSDLNAVKAKAVPQSNGTYRIFGTKIFISYGEHDLADNIIHLVLARLPDAPEGTRGISLFVVPKRLVKDDGTLGDRNDVVCTGIEHKLGIHASPTCVMTYGEKDGAVGYLVGEENKGLRIMFVMMNAARLAVGVQGVAVAERARQQAFTYAHERLQGQAPGSNNAMDPIIRHPDVQRMVMTMAALTQAARCICFATAGATDRMNRALDKAEKMAAADRVALLTPIAKAFSTDTACRVSSLGVQVHGGMGYVEETGAAQYYRDARILPIYEGTNGIQAIDLVTRKLPMKNGEVVRAYLADIQSALEEIFKNAAGEVKPLKAEIASATAILTKATKVMATLAQSNEPCALAVATPYLDLFGLTIGAFYLASCFAAAENGTAEKENAQALLDFYVGNVLTASAGLLATIKAGGDSVLSKPAARYLEASR